MKDAQNLQKKQSGKKRTQKKNTGFSGKDTLLLGLALFVVFAAGFSGFYIWKARLYKDAFFMNTYINGIDASGKTVAEMKELITSGIEGYRLEIRQRDNNPEYLKGESVNLHSEFDGSLDRIIEAQSPYLWVFHSFRDSSYQIETMIGYDSELLEKQLGKLKCLNPEKATPPENAYLSDYVKGKGYEIVPEQEGTLVDEEIAAEGIRQALKSLKREVSLAELGAYIPPEVTQDDEQLIAQRDMQNRYIELTITHQFGESREILDGDTTHKWLTFDEQGNILLDEAAVADYVAELAKNYNTAYKPKKLKTSYGDTVTITGGNYGWRINQSAEAAAISEIIRSGESQEREPIYSQTAASHGEHDYGDTYVEINLTAQHLHYYVNGSLLVEADFVSGNDSKGWSTPAGAYPLTYKQRNATLKGEGYATPVSYWMPFNGGVGMHDAKWRGTFGGTIYKTNGSHGCVNLPPAAAKTIYENISAGIPVLCYHLTGSAAAPDPVLPPETTPVETLPVETSPVETAPTETESQPPETTPEETRAPETTAAPPETEHPVISPPGEETTQPQTTPAPTQPQTSSTEETPIIGPAGSTRAPEPEVGPGV